MQEIHPTLIKFLEALEDEIENELSFQDSMHGLREDDFRRDLNTIEDFIYQYSDEIDMFSFFEINSEADKISIDQSIIDYADYCETEEKLIKARKKLKEMNFDLDLFNDKCRGLYLKILDTKIDIAEYPDYFKDTKSYDSFTDSIKKLIFDKNIQYIDEQFNSSNYHLNPLYKKLYKLLKSEIDQKFNTTMENFNYETRFYQFFNIHKQYTPVIEPYLKYYNLFKHLAKLPEEDSNKFDLNKFDSAEHIYDFVIKSVDHSELKKYMKSFLGSYMDLANEETFEIFKCLKNNNYSKEDIKKSLRNIAIFDESTILNLTLQQFIDNKLIQHSSSILNEIKQEGLNVDVLYNHNNLLAIRVNDFHTSSVLAKNNWCIGRNKSFYDSYLKDDSYYHVFIYDFTKKTTHSCYKIGITFSEKGISQSFTNTNASLTTHEVYDLLDKDKVDCIQQNNKYINNVKKIIDTNQQSFDLISDIHDKIYLLSKINLSDCPAIHVDLQDIKFNSLILSKQEQLETFLNTCKYLDTNPFDNNYFKTAYLQLPYLDRFNLDKEYSLKLSNNQNSNILQKKNKMI